MSGSAFCEWAFSKTNRVVEETEKLASAVGCVLDNSAVNNALLLKNCLKRKTVDEIQAAMKKIVSFFRKIRLCTL